MSNATTRPTAAAVSPGTPTSAPRKGSEESEELTAALAALSSFQSLTQQADAKANMLLALHLGVSAVTATQVRWPYHELPNGVGMRALTLVATASAIVYLVSFVVDGYLLVQVIRPRIESDITNRFAVPSGRVRGRVPAGAFASGSGYSVQAWRSARAVADIAAVKYRLVDQAVSWTAILVAAAALWISLGGCVR